MSTQAYTNRRRTLAEANNRKVQYPGRVATNINPIYSTINCSPAFQPLTYTEICGCSFNRRGTTHIPSPKFTWLDGSNSGTGVGNVAYRFDGGNAGTGVGNVTYSFDGGSA